jgi:hypothetical protein
MSEWATHILSWLALPAHWLATVVGLPADIGYWSTGVASAFVLIALGCALLAFYTWLHRRQFFFLLAYIVLLGVGGIGFWTILHYQAAWLYAIFLILIGADLFGRLIVAPTTPTPARRVLIFWSIFTVLVAICTPLAIREHALRVRNSANQQLTTALTAELDTLSGIVKKASEQAETLAGDASIQAALQQNSAPATVALLQQKLVENGLQFLTLTNATGVVLGRAQEPLLYGDILPDPVGLPWLSTAYEGTSTKGIGWNEHGLPVMVAAEPIRKNEQITGMVVAGYFLDQNFLQTEKKRTGTAFALAMYGGNEYINNQADQQALFQGDAFDAVVTDQLEAETIQFESTYQNNQALGMGKLILDLAEPPHGPIALVTTVQNGNSFNRILLDSGIVLAIATLLLIATPFIFRRRPNDKKKPHA